MRLKVWKMKPISSRRILASSSFGVRLISLPSSKKRPLVGRSRQPMMFSRVDLPLPDGPINATNSPFSISRSMPFKTGYSLLPMR